MPYTKEQTADLERYRADAGTAYHENRERGAEWERPVVLEMPLGEIADNWALAMIYGRRGGWTEGITGKERFNAQGLEGKACIPLPYGDALLHSQFIDQWRFRIVKAKK